MIVAAFDPGYMTGYAWVDTHSDRYAFAQIPSDKLAEIEKKIVEDRPDIILYEDFKHRGALIQTELYSLQVIGVIRLVCDELNIETWKCLPAEAKAFWKDNKLKRLGLYKPAWRHAMDATRVLLTWRMKFDKEWKSSIIPFLKIQA